MKRLSWLLLLGLSFPLVGQSSGIYKCTGGREVAYQSFPCAEGVQEALMVPSSQPAYAQIQNAKPIVYSALAQPTPISAQEPRPSMPFQRTTLALGMTDDEVLNLAHWGRPAKIIRSKGNRVWREQWVYASLPDGAKRLYFENTKLTAVENEPAPLQQMASLTVQ